jgi:hypothetical protein
MIFIAVARSGGIGLWLIISSRDEIPSQGIYGYVDWEKEV